MGVILNLPLFRMLWVQVASWHMMSKWVVMKRLKFPQTTFRQCWKHSKHATATADCSSWAINKSTFNKTVNAAKSHKRICCSIYNSKAWHTDWDKNKTLQNEACPPLRVWYCQDNGRLLWTVSWQHRRRDNNHAWFTTSVVLAEEFWALRRDRKLANLPPC